MDKEKEKDDLKQSNINTNSIKNKDIKKKKIRANTEVSIKGEYHKIDIIKTKINGKKINSESYTFCYEHNNFVTKFNLKNVTKNFKYFICYKRAKGCEGKAVYEIQKKEFKVYNSCNFDILIIILIMKNL